MTERATQRAAQRATRRVPRRARGRSAGASAALLFAVGCAAPAAPPPDFGANPAPRYAWLEPIGPRHPELRAALRGAIDAALQARGCRPAAGAPPDFYVAYRFDVERRTLVRSESGSSQTVNSFHGPAYTISPTRYETSFVDELRLVVALAGPDRRELWSGRARTTARDASVPDAGDAVEQAFAAWQPGATPQ